MLELDKEQPTKSAFPGITRTVTRLGHAAHVIIAGRGNSAAAVQSLLTKFLILALNASTSIVVARVLKPAGRGEMSALVLWSGFLTQILTLGLPSSVVFNLRHKIDQTSRVIGAALLMAFGVSLVVGIAGEVAVPIWLSKYPSHDILYARWFLLSAPIPIFTSLGRAVMEAKGRFSQSNMAIWSGHFFTLISLLILAGLHHLTPLTGGLAYVCGSVPGVTWIVFRIYADYRPELSGVGRALVDLLHYGLRSWGIDLLNGLASQADQLLVIRFLTPAAMGVYVVAGSLARLLGAFESSASMVLFPRIAARNRSEVVALTGQVLRITTICTALGAVVTGILGPILLRTIYGGQYAEDGTAVFRVLLAEIVIAGATQILAQAFMALERPGVVTIVQGVGIGIGLILMPFLISRFGVVGAGVAMLTSTSIRFVLTLLCFRPLLKAPAPKLLVTRDDLAFVVGRFANFFPATSVTAE